MRYTNQSVDSKGGHVGEDKRKSRWRLFHCGLANADFFLPAIRWKFQHPKEEAWPKSGTAPKFPTN